MKKRLLLYILTIALLATLFSACKDKIPVDDTSSEESLSQEDKVKHNQSLTTDDVILVQKNLPKEGDKILVMETTRGTLYFILYPQYTPLAVENFAVHQEEGFYNGSRFGTIIENFYVESGPPSDTPNLSIYTNKDGEPVGFENEVSTHLWNFRGALVMKNDGSEQPDSNRSKFFIVQAKTIGEEWFEEMESIGYPPEVKAWYEKQGGIPGYDARYTVFGQLYAGFDVLDDIAETPTNSAFLPQDTIHIEQMTVADYNMTLHLPSELKGKTFIDASEEAMLDLGEIKLTESLEQEKVKGKVEEEASSATDLETVA